MLLPGLESKPGNGKKVSCPFLTKQIKMVLVPYYETFYPGNNFHTK
jgi:hypothetical protein